MKPDGSASETRNLLRMAIHSGPIVSAGPVPEGHQGEYVPSREELIAGLQPIPATEHVVDRSAVVEAVRQLLSDWPSEYATER